MKSDPLKTIQKLIKERYSDAKAVFWAGSMSQNKGTKNSDLDLVIVFESLPNAYREAFVYDGWPIDAFINDPTTLRYFFEESQSGNGISGLIEMILQGREILEPDSFFKNIYKMAQQYKKAGPAIWSQAQINHERFLITDILDDIKFSKNRDEQLISAVHLFEPLVQFYFRADKKWTASGKALMRLLKTEDPDLALELNQSFDHFFQTRDTLGIENIVQKILTLHGGFLWDGFRSDSPSDWKITQENDLYQDSQTKIQNKIYELEASLLEPSTRKSTEKLNALLADNFYEIGASGNIYNKKEILESLPLEQIISPYGQIIDFGITKITEDLTRSNYLLKEQNRTTRRTSLWQNHNNSYQIIFHQETVINKD